MRDDGGPTRLSIGVGSVIAGTYTIERVIGRGGMGTVYLASHKRLPGKQVAIKMLHVDADADASASKEILDRFQHEAQITSTLGHPNIVGVDDFNQLPDGTPYIVLEYLQGESLAHKLRAGPIPLDQVLSIVRQVGSALAAAHRAGIVHRDLKPQNIFLVPTEVDGEIIQIAKVLDFGISKIKGSNTVKTQDSTLLGTPQYMSPEQATGQHTLVDERTDVFALGSIVYEMLCGRAAFNGASIPEVVFKVVYEEPAALVANDAAPTIVQAVSRAMAKAPAERFANVSEFVEALTGQALLAPRGTSIPPPDVGFATGSKAASKEAFAKTMGSADGSIALAGTMASISPDAETMASQSPIASTVAKVAPLPPVPHRSVGKIVVIALAGAAIAAAAMYFVMRPDKPQPIAMSSPRDAARADAVAAPPDTPPIVVDAPPTDAAVAIDAGHVDAAHVDAPHAAAHRPDVPVVPTGEGSGDPVTAETVKRAEAATRAGDPDLAIKEATAVINSPSPTSDQVRRAHVVRALAYCAQRDQDGVNRELRKTGHSADGAIKIACEKTDTSYSLAY